MRTATWLALELAEWDSNEWVDPKLPFRLGFAPDELMKAGSAAVPATWVLPARTADPPLVHAEYQEGVMLAEYLRALLGPSPTAPRESVTSG